MIWINLAKDRDQGRALLKLVTNFEVLQNFVFCIYSLIVVRSRRRQLMSPKVWYQSIKLHGVT